MRTVLLCCVLVAATAAVTLWRAGHPQAAAPAEPKLVHNVFFSLANPTPENRDKLVAACKKYLAKHPGVVFFAAGTLCEELKREVNDRDWDVGLHVVFDTKANQDKYQDAPMHLQFIAEN